MTNNLAIIIDLDNVIIDTAFRKKKILSAKFSTELSIDQIKEDYELSGVLGGVDTEVYKNFFAELNTSQSIENIEAPIYDNANSVINNLIDDNITVFVLTGRHKKTRDVTIKELKTNGIYSDKIILMMPEDDLINESSLLEYKAGQINQIIDNYKVLGIIGDRPSDINAGIKCGITTILFNTGKLNNEFVNEAGHFVCDDWIDLYSIIRKIKYGSIRINELRTLMINQYANWLSDIDNKARINVTIGIGLAALTGNILINKATLFETLIHWKNIDVVLIGICFLTSIFSIIFSIYTMTSRHTSGLNATDQIGRKLFNHSMFLLFHNKRFDLKKHKYIGDNDPVKIYDDLKKKNEREQAMSHIKFFNDKYNTFNDDAILNLRLFAMRATNYSKIYPERISSKLLIFSIIIISLWVIIKAAENLF